MAEFTKRVLKPASIPLAAFGFIGILVFAFSRVLLAVPELGSTSLALLMSVAVLLVCAVFAATRRVKASQRFLLLLGTIGLLGAGAAAGSIGVREIHAEEKVEIAAEALKFLETSVHVPADEPITMEFQNLDAGVQHNVSIWSDDSFAPPALFIGEIFPGVATQEYEIEPLAAGTYAFRCDVHIDMVGTLTAGEEGPPPGGGSPPPGEVPTSIEITAEGFVFDHQDFALKADVPTSIVFHNQDPAPGGLHNLAIYTDESASEEIFREEPFTGPSTVTYELPPVEPGEYFFRCDIHPTMNGTVEFA